MGAFNMVNIETRCPQCGTTSVMELQFKYGHTWQITYAPGDLLEWGGNDHGKPGKKKVLASAISGPCLHCDLEFVECSLLIESDRIIRTEPFSEAVERASEPFLVIED